MNDIVRHKTIPAVDVSDQALIERATIDHVETLLDMIRPMDAQQPDGDELDRRARKARSTMTYTTPRHYADADLVSRGMKEGNQMRLDQKSILRATGIVLAELRDEHRKAAAEMQAAISALQNRIETLERAMPASRLRAVSE